MTAPNHHMTNTRSEGDVRAYNRARITYFVVGVVFSWITSALFIFSGASRRIARSSQTAVRSEPISSSLTVAIFMLLSWLISLPLAYLRGYRLEHKYELSNQSTSAWLGEQLKGLAVQLVLLVPISQVMLGIIRRRPRDWWAVLSMLAIPFTVVLTHLFPVLIAPLFNTYQPLRDQELAERLKALAARAGIDVAEVMEMDLSRQTRKATAFFTGVGSTKRIVLADTLLEEFTPEEIETIVAHEIAHQAHRDIWRLLTLGAVTTAVIAYVTQRLSQATIDRTARRTGIASPAGVDALPVLGLVGSIAGMLLMPLQNAASRYIERQADNYALELSDDPESFASALTRLQHMNLVDPEPSRLEQVLLHSHPTISQRLKVCEEFAARRESAA